MSKKKALLLEKNLLCTVQVKALKKVALNALNCYAYDEGSQSTSDTAEERSYMSCPDIAACFNSAITRKVVDYAWRPVTDSKLLGFLGGVVHKKRGWFPYKNGQALVLHMKDYPFRVSFILRQGTWWLSKGPKTSELKTNLAICSFLKRPSTRRQPVTVTSELVDQLLEHFVDPVNGSPSKGRKSVGVLSLHVDDLIISGTSQFLKWCLEKIKKHFTVGIRMSMT